eukprot:ANDGO_06269.mRNA.1 Pre-rRNA-processing protein esf2
MSGSSDSEQHVISHEELERIHEKSKRKGVVYVSRVPPNMKHTKLRKILSEFGSVERIYLRAEDDAARNRRKAANGSAQKQFVDGWVEFADKRIARRVAECLNGTPMDPSKRGFYHDDIWMLKYLKGTKWSEIQDEISEEAHVREQRVRAEVQTAKKEVSAYMSMVDKKKKLDHVMKRKEGKPESIHLKENKFRQRQDFSQTRLHVLDADEVRQTLRSDEGASTSHSVGANLVRRLVGKFTGKRALDGAGTSSDGKAVHADTNEQTERHAKKSKSGESGIRLFA